MSLALAELFPDEDYRFHLTLRKGNLHGFFGESNEKILTERRRWLNADPATYALATEGAEPLLTEFETLAMNWLPANAGGLTFADPATDRLATLGGKLEPDFMLLARDEAGVFRLRAGVVCFPSSWALAEKMDLTLAHIHGVVPGLNPSIGGAIDQFLERLKPGTAYERTNWGLAATAELNLHPKLHRPRLALPFDPQKTWVRIEDQILAGLPRSGGILFGIRLRLVPLARFFAEERLKIGFRRAISTMPDALVAYKGIEPIKTALITAFN